MLGMRELIVSILIVLLSALSSFAGQCALRITKVDSEWGNAHRVSIR